MDFQTKISSSPFKNDIRILIDENNNAWFCVVDLAKILDIKHINNNIALFPSTEKSSFITQTTGGRQKMNYLTEQGVLRLLARSRKSNATELARILGVNVHRSRYTPIEEDILQHIEDVFGKCESMIKQYRVGKYFIDLYFPDYKLAIECDEHHHQCCAAKDKEREKYIKDNIQDVQFIRLKPISANFNIFFEIGNIYNFIKTLK